MIDKFLRDIVNLFIYGGLFIGLCSACLTSLSLSVIGQEETYYLYSVWIGICTAALYAGHRVIGLRKMAHITTSERFNVIRKYQSHIWIYFIFWIIVAGFFFLKIGTLSLIGWMIPGGFIAIGYVLPLLGGKQRFRDLGWGKIIMIGWSWAWLTSFIPLWYLAREPLGIVMVMTLARMLFIIAITIPFEVRDMMVDKSVGLMTLPEKFGRSGTDRIMQILCFSVAILSCITSIHYHQKAFFITMSIIAMLSYLIYRKSDKTQDDYFFGGLTDGLMIAALLLYTSINHFI